MDEEKKKLEAQRKEMERLNEEKAAKMEEEIECCICMLTLMEPRSLECGHTSCHQCLDDWVSQKENKKKPECPTCRAPIDRDPVPSVIIKNLIENHMKDQSVEDQEEYKERKKEYDEWKKKHDAENKKKGKKKKKKRRRPNPPAAAAAVPGWLY